MLPSEFNIHITELELNQPLEKGLYIEKSI